LTRPAASPTIAAMPGPTERRQDEARLAGGWNEVLERDAARADHDAGKATDAAEEAAWGIRSDRAAFGRDYDGAPLPAAKVNTPHG